MPLLEGGPVGFQNGPLWEEAPDEVSCGCYCVYAPLSATAANLCESRGRSSGQALEYRLRVFLHLRNARYTHEVAAQNEKDTKPGVLFSRLRRSRRSRRMRRRNAIQYRGDIPGHTPRRDGEKVGRWKKDQS